MQKQSLPIARLIFLVVLVAVFLFTYLADFNLFSVVFSAISTAFPWAMRFYIPFFILSSIGLISYYIIYEKTNDAQRYLPWLKIYSLAFMIGFLICSLIIYFKIYTNQTFDP